MDDLVFEVNNLILRLDGLRDQLRQENSAEELLFSKKDEAVRLWKHLENGVCGYIRERSEEVSIGEIIYVLSAFLKWHLEKAMKEYYNKTDE